MRYLLICGWQFFLSFHYAENLFQQFSFAYTLYL